jgi:phage terminase large subunit
MAKTYILKEGGIHERFFASRNKIQFFGGGFGNGKTSAMVVKAIIQVAIDYPGCNILMARSTYPKLNDTMRRTFLEFCPAEWIKSFPLSKNSDNTCVLNNGTTINFRYVSQRKATEDGGSTSNLLSATYDLIVLDQIEDPEIIHKDFLDLMGRLRGSAIYRGKDPTMPRTGPRWFFISSNPTRNWVYKKLIEPLKKYQLDGTITDDLLCDRDSDGKPELIDGKPKIIIDLIEGSTYENSHVLEGDFIKGLEATYTGQMRNRFLKGEWAAYEGLVYPEYSSISHSIKHDRLMLYLRDCIRNGMRPKWLAGYDFGMVSPSCFILAFTDTKSNIFLLDGFHKSEASIEWQSREMLDIMNRYSATVPWIMADPDIFRRKAGDNKTVGKSISDLFFDSSNGKLLFTRGNNDIDNGIIKVGSYLQNREYHLHPITGEPSAPYLYHSDRLTWFEEEITAYYWQSNTSGERVDKPTDKNDHAMDTIKYLLSHAPEPATISTNTGIHIPSYMTEWQEIERAVDNYAHRH